MSHVLLSDVFVDSITNDFYRLVESNDRFKIFLRLPADPFSQTRELRFREESAESLHQMLASGRMRRLESHPYWPKFKGLATSAEIEDNDEVRKKANDLQARRLAVVMNVVAGGLKRLVGHGKAAYLKAVAQEFTVTVESVRKWLAAYLTLGMTESALYPRYDRRGGKGRHREPGEAKRGRPAIYEGEAGINVSPKLADHIKSFIIGDLENMRSVDESYRVYCEASCSDGIRIGEAGNEETIILPSYMRPSKWVFRKIYTQLAYKDKMIGRFGITEWNKHLRDILGNEGARAFLPGAVYQLDFSRSNIIVLHDKFRHPIGRPLFGLGTDVGSPMIVGQRLSMANPSEQEALLLCEHIFLSKVPSMRNIGLDIEHGEWPVEGTPNKVCADNGELRGKRSKILSKDLTVIFELQRAWTPTDKGTIESKFGRYKNHEIPWLPGHSPRNRERGDAKCELDECMSISAFRQIMALITLDLIQEPIENRFMPPGALAEGRLPSGIDLWNWSMESGLGGLRPCPDADVLRFMFMPRAKARVKGKGFFYGGLHYISKELSAMGYFAARRRRSQWVEIVFEPNLVDCIYVADKNDKVHICPLAEKEMAMYGHQRLSFDDVDALVGRRRRGIYKAADAQLQRKSNREAFITDILAAEKDLNKHILHKTTYSLASISADSMKLAQSMAAAEEKKANARVVNPEGNGKNAPHLTLMPPPPATPVADSAPSDDSDGNESTAMKDDLAMLRKIGRKSK
jgi:hypothetical protein